MMCGSIVTILKVDSHNFTSDTLFMYPVIIHLELRRVEDRRSIHQASIMTVMRRGYLVCRVEKSMFFYSYRFIEYGVRILIKVSTVVGYGSLSSTHFPF